MCVGRRALRSEGAGQGGGAADAPHRHAARPLHVQLRCAEEAALLPAHPWHDPGTANAQQGGSAASQLLQSGARGRDGRAAAAHHPDSLPRQPSTLLGRASRDASRDPQNNGGRRRVAEADADGRSRTVSNQNYVF